MYVYMCIEFCNLISFILFYKHVMMSLLFFNVFKGYKIFQHMEKALTYNLVLICCSCK